MRAVGTELLNQLAPGQSSQRLARLLSIGLLAASCSLIGVQAEAGSPAAGPPVCSLNSNLSDFTGKMARTGQIAMAPMTTVLPPGGDAWMAFHQPLQDNAGDAGAATNLFLIFETDAATGTVDLPITSIAPVGASAPSGFNPTDSTQMQFSIGAQLFPLWGLHHFIVVECSPAGTFKDWGRATARVSNPDIARGIATLVALCTYLLSVTAVYKLRQKKNQTADPYLADTYPALFGAKPISRLQSLNPIYLTEDSLHLASVQKLQVLLFSYLTGWLLLSLVLRSGTLIDLSPTVVGLMGISGIGAVTSHVAYQQKTRLSFSNWAWLHQRKVVEAPKDENDLRSPEWKDLVMTYREFDIYKLQTIIFSITVAIAMVVDGASSLASFTVPDNLLGLLGLSQVVYVGGIMVRPPSVNDLDNALTKLRQAGEIVAAAKVQNTDTGQDGKLLKSLPAGQKEPAVNAQRQYDDMARDVVPMIESALEVKVNAQNL